MKRQRKNERREERNGAATRRVAFKSLEQLEPRVLLSADPLLAVVATDLIEDGSPAETRMLDDAPSTAQSAVEATGTPADLSNPEISETAHDPFDWSVDPDVTRDDVAETEIGERADWVIDDPRSSTAETAPAPEGATDEMRPAETASSVVVAQLVIHDASEPATIPSVTSDDAVVAEVPDDVLARGPPSSDTSSSISSEEQQIRSDSRVDPDTSALRAVPATITAAAEAAIRSGLQSLSDWLDDLDALAIFQQALPLINRTVEANSDLPNALVEMVGAVNAYFDGLGGADPTTDGLIAALLALIDVSSVTGGLEGDEFQFDVDFQQSFNPAAANLDLSGSLSAIDLELDASAALAASGGIDLNFQFGFDTTNLTFFLRFNGLTVDAAASAGGIALGARLGFIDIAAASGSADVSGSIDVTLVDPDNADGRGYISLSELTGTPVGTLVSTNLTGTANLDLTITSSLIPAPVVLELDWADVSQPTVETSNLATLGSYFDLEALSPSVLVDGLIDLAGWTGSFDNPFSLGSILPVIGRNFASSLDLPGLFGQLLDSQLGVFDSVDTFLTQLLAVVGLDNVGATLQGDQLYFDFDVDASRNRSVAFSWDEAGLVNLSLDIPALTMGVQVGRRAAGRDRPEPAPVLHPDRRAAARAGGHGQHLAAQLQRLGRDRVPGGRRHRRQRDAGSRCLARPDRSERPGPADQRPAG